MKYKPGNKVVVKTWEEVQKDPEFGNVDDINAVDFIDEMKEFCGKVLTINTIERDVVEAYLVDENNWSWQDWMIDRLAEHVEPSTPWPRIKAAIEAPRGLNSREGVFQIRYNTNYIATTASKDGVIKVGTPVRVEPEYDQTQDKLNYTLYGLGRVGTSHTVQRNDVRFFRDSTNNIARQKLEAALEGVEVILDQAWARRQVDELQEEIRSLEDRYKLYAIGDKTSLGTFVGYVNSDEDVKALPVKQGYWVEVSKPFKDLEIGDRLQYNETNGWRVL